MKTVSVSKTSLVMAFATVAALASTLYSSPALAEGGYNGPDLHPISIPLQLDRGIDLDQVRGAVSACLITGDDRQRLISMAQRVYGAYFGKTPKSRSLKSNIEWGDSLGLKSGDIRTAKYHSFLCALAGLPSTWEPNLMHARSDDAKSWKVVHVARNSESNAAEFAFILRSGKDREACMVDIDVHQRDGWELLSLKTELPIVEYQSSVIENRFDAWGNATPHTILSGLSIKLPANYGPAVPLTNSESGAPSKLTVNLQEYAQCLQARIQSGNSR